MSETTPCRAATPRPGRWRQWHAGWCTGPVGAGLVLALALPAAAHPAQGRWEGSAAIPGAPMPLIIDLQCDATRTCLGSLILPGRSVKGAPLDDLVMNEQGVHFSLAAVFAGAAPTEPADVHLQWHGDGRLSGELRQAGHRAPLVLARSGDAQLDRPTPARPLSPEMAGTWRGRYELGGYARDVTLTLRPPGTAPAGELVIVGKRRSVLAIDRVHQGREFLTLESSQAGVRIEGRWNAQAGRIDGHFLQGPFEAALVMHRQGAAGRPAAGDPP
jgi:hypothetical protein